MANSSSGLFEELERILDVGVISPQCSSCCPDCGNIYVFASVETYLKFYEALQPIPASTDCCTNTCLKEFQDLADPESYDFLMGKGIVEYSTFNGKSFLCYITDYLNAYGYTLGNSSLAEVLDVILDKGIVIYCDGENQIIASVETFLKYVEAQSTSIINFGEECCLSVIANVETYLIYSEGTSPNPPVPA